jgi:hypothetical protein
MRWLARESSRWFAAPNRRPGLRFELVALNRAWSIRKGFRGGASETI